jgi:hypothetical protein
MHCFRNGGKATVDSLLRRMRCCKSGNTGKRFAAAYITLARFYLWSFYRKTRPARCTTFTDLISFPAQLCHEIKNNS